MTAPRAGARMKITASLYSPVLATPSFLLRKLAYARRLRRSALPMPAPEVAQHARTLHRDGIVIIRDFLDASTVSSMRDSVPEIRDFVVSEEGDQALFYHDAGQISAFKPFFQHPFVRETARALISADAIQLRQEVCLKIVHGDILSFEQFSHIDTWKMRMKAFLFLEDVSEENGPMIYYEGSHRGLWHLPMEARIANWYRTDEAGFALPDDYFVGCFWPYEVQRLAEAHNYREVRCTGPAGTLMMFNGRGLHRATPLQDGRRLILSSYWIHCGDHT